MVIKLLLYLKQKHGINTEKYNLAQTKDAGCYSQMIRCLLRIYTCSLYKTDLWKVGITDVEMLSFSNILDKFIGIDPKAPTIIGIT